MVQLSPLFVIGLGILFIIGIVFGVLFKSVKEYRLQFLTLVHSSEVYLIFGSYIVVIGFLTINKSYSYAGETPVIALLYVFLIVLSNAVFHYIRFDKKYFYIPILIFLSISLFRNYGKIANLYLYPISDFKKFASMTKQFRDKNLLNNVKFVQAFSHPVYNSLAVIWNLHLLNEDTPTDLIGSTPPTEESFFMAHSHSIPDLVRILSTYPFLILPDEEPIQYGGEYFAPINIHNSEIVNQIIKSDKFDCDESFKIGKDQFPIKFCLNKTHRIFKFSKITEDGWIEWGYNSILFSKKDIVLKLSVDPLRVYKTFYLLDIDDNKKYYASLTALASSKTQYEYEIKIPGKNLVRNLKLLAEANDMLPASNLDNRKLAFRNVYISFIEK